MTPARRLLWLAAAIVLVALPQNPLVRAEALLGLSPAPLERYLGVKNAFSGMTEGMHQLAHGNLAAAFAANCLTPFVAAGAAGCLLAGWRPRMRSRRHELVAAALFVAASLLVNLVHGAP